MPRKDSGQAGMTDNAISIVMFLMQR